MAEPPSSKKKSTKETSSSKADSAKIAPSTQGVGWSLVNGVWMHSDGYKFVNGQVVRSSAATHKPAPKPPTQADVQASNKKKTAPKSAAEVEAAKTVERERNLAPRPASQTGTHL